MVVALGADFPIRFEVLFPDDGAAGAAFGPHAFGADTALFDRRGIFDWFFFAFKPGHGFCVRDPVNSSKSRVRS
jgi:hypothetical protein